jgi:hypothetical protein
MAHLLRIVPAAILPAAGLLAACATTAPSHTTSSKPQQTLSLESLAKETGCTVQVQTNATQLRQGACDTSAGRYVVLTFPTDRDTATWLTEAKIWGGTYLVGKHWVIVGTRPQLRTFQDRLGGSVQAGESHASHG